MLKINLLPPEHRPQAAVSFPRLAFALAFGLILFATAVWLLGEYMTLNQINQDILKADQELRLYGPQYQNVLALERQQAEISKKEGEIAAVMQPYVPVAELLGEIIAPLPEKLWLRSISVNDTGLVTLDGRSDRLNAIAVFMLDLESSPLIKNTKLENINNSSAKGAEDIFDFRLTFEMEKAGMSR